MQTAPKQTRVHRLQPPRLDMSRFAKFRTCKACVHRALSAFLKHLSNCRNDLTGTARYIGLLPFLQYLKTKYADAIDANGMLSGHRLEKKDKETFQIKAGIPSSVNDTIQFSFRNASCFQETVEILQKQDIYQAIFQPMRSMNAVRDGLTDKKARGGYDLEMAISNTETAIDALLVAEEQIAYYSGIDLNNYHIDLPDHHHIEYENQYYSMQPLESSMGERHYTPPEGSVATPQMLQNGTPIDPERRLHIY